MAIDPEFHLPVQDSPTDHESMSDSEFFAFCGKPCYSCRYNIADADGLCSACSDELNQLPFEKINEESI